MMQLKALIVMLYRKYNIELVNKNNPLITHYTVIRYCDELKVKIENRICFVGIFAIEFRPLKIPY